MNSHDKSYTIASAFGLCAMLTCGLAYVAHAQGTPSKLRLTGGLTRVEMRHIDFRMDPEVLFHIEEMRGELIPLEHNHPPIFDDKRSFGIGIERGTIALSMASMASLLNNYVLAYQGTPIRNVSLSTRNGELLQSATVRGIPATILGNLSVTPEGLIRFTPQSIKMAGVPTKTLMDALDVHTERIVHPDESRGLKIAGDDILMDINQFPTAPRLYGHLVRIRLEANSLIETFAPDPRKSEESSEALSPPVSSPTFMYFYGGVVRFGKLIMSNTDLEILSEHQQDWLDFDLDHYNDQLSAGCTVTTRSFALVSRVPDYPKVEEKSRPSK